MNLERSLRSGKKVIFQSVPFALQWDSMSPIFIVWKKQLTPVSLAPSSFMPIQMKSCTDGTLALSGTQVSKQKSSVPNATNRDFCEIVYPNGVTLRIGANLTLDMLRTLIALNP